MKLQKIKKFWATALLLVFHSLPLPSFVHNVMDFLLWPLSQKLKTFFAFLLLPFFCFSRCCSSFWPSLDIKEAVSFFSKSAILYPENLLFQNFMLFLIDFFLCLLPFLIIKIIDTLFSCITVVFQHPCSDLNSAW